MTTNFYAPPSVIRSGRVVLPEQEARHARTVLRVGRGDEIPVVDGEGGWYRVRVDRAGSDQLVGSIVQEESDVGEPAVEVTVGIGILKKRSRFETFVEKAVELGVYRIVPLRTRRTERESVRTDRLRKVMVAAMKQCRRSWLPILSEPKSPGALVAEGVGDTGFVCHGGGDSVPIRRAVAGETGIHSATVLVGPEGGFHDAEVEDAVASGFTPVSLGRRRLRAETAGLAVLNSLLTLVGPSS